MTETFSDWLHQQAGRDDAIGELARYVDKDDMFPKHGDHAIYEGYFEPESISADMRGTFGIAWNEFEGLPS